MVRGAEEGPEGPEGSLGGLGRCEEDEGLGQDPDRRPGGAVGRDWEAQGGSATRPLKSGSSAFVSLGRAQLSTRSPTPGVVLSLHPTLGL